ncbi:uncharacterized protein [Branchiostoma lanceolatum]|uniref:uncharacterized protein isoform X2 n=1 Tax=Branchiostoma lanceolatum TaxID=7740 RepID=UPI0034522F92
MRRFVLSLVLTAFLSQQSSTAGSVVTRRPTRSVPCLVDADCLVFQKCSWDVTGPTGICLARKKLIRRVALNQKPTNSRSLQRATATPPVKSKTASKRFKHDTSAYQPGAFGGSNEPIRFDNQNYGRTTSGTSENVFSPNQGGSPPNSQQYHGASPLSGRDRNGGWQHGSEWPISGGPKRIVQNNGPRQATQGVQIQPSLGQDQRIVQNAGPKQATPDIIILPSLGQNHGFGKQQPNMHNVVGQSLPHASPPTYGTESNFQNERQPTGYISGPISGGQQKPMSPPRETFPTIDNHGIALSSGPTEEHSSEGRDDWRSHVTTFREDSTDEEIVLDNSKDVNYVHTVPKHVEPNRGHASSQGARFHDISRENRERAGNHQTGRQHVQHTQQQNFKSHLPKDVEPNMGHSSSQTRFYDISHENREKAGNHQTGRQHMSRTQQQNFNSHLPKYVESNRGYSPSQSATAGGRFHGVSDENRENAGNHQTGGQNVEHIKQQIANLRGLLDSPREAPQSDGVHVEQHHKERLPNTPTGNPVVYDPILKEPTGVEDDVDELDIGSPRGDKKDYF